MNKEFSPRNLKNAAWVVIPTRLTTAVLFNFCRDIERVFRLNPYLKIISWRERNANKYEIELENYSNEQVIEVSAQIKVEELQNELQLNYSSGIKNKTYFIVEETDRGAQLMIVDDYGESNQQVVEQVDKSLSAWGNALERFFAAYKLVRHFPWADKIINRWWIRLNPSGRRIIYILMVITAIELLALLLFVILYWWL